MSDETKRDGQTADGTPPPLDEEAVKRLAAEYQEGLRDIYEGRKRRADALAAMTEEEFEAAMRAELEEMLADAERSRKRRAAMADDGSSGDGK